MWIYLFLMLPFFSCIHCQTSKVYSLVYRDVDVLNYDKCVRIFNGTNQIGCQSLPGGNVGVVYVIDTQAKIEEFVNTARLHSYIVVLNSFLFNGGLVRRFKTFSKVKGIIVYEDGNSENILSPDLQCPNSRFGLYNNSYGSEFEHCSRSENLWNPAGDGLNEEDIPFPVFYLKSDTDRDQLINCYKTHNTPEEYPICAAEMKSWMFGAVDTPTCIRRTQLQNTLSPAAYCDPLGGHNVVTSLKLLTTETGAMPTILATAPIDSRSFMETDSAPGANLGTGFISLLGVASALGSLTSEEKQDLEKNIVFVLFDGEAYDNMGSTRMIFDMKNGNFPVVKDVTKATPTPVTMEDITNIIEFRQLGLTGSDIWAHFDPVSYLSNDNVKTQVDNMVTELNRPTSDVGVQKADTNIPLIPSSLQTILKDRTVPGIVLSDYHHNFTNKVYFSRYDTLRNLNVRFNENSTDKEVIDALQPLAEKLANISTISARMLYSLASSSGEVPDKISTNTEVMAQLLFCYLYKPNCTLLKEGITTIQNINALNGGPFNRYVSTFGDKTLWVKLAYNLLAYFTGDRPQLNATTCKSNNSNDQTSTYFYFNGPEVNSTHRSNICVRSSSFLMDAIASAFQANTLAQNVDVYGIWSESRWSKSSFRLRMFLIQNQVDQGIVFLAGLLILIPSFIVVYILNTKANILFESTTGL